MEEVWKDIDGYVGLYQVSNLGNVKSLPRSVVIGNKIQHRKERIMAKRENSDGYYIAKLNVNGMSKNISIHRLVAIAFVDNPDGLPEVNHKDCNRKNNNYQNLEWCTHDQNVKYSARLKHYRTPSGTDNPNYGNRKLHNKYLSNPELRSIQSRPCNMNGMAKPVLMYMESGSFIASFEWIGECAQYLICNGIVRSNSVNSVRTAISKSIKNKKPYFGYKFKFC